ncbi:hypothetical protein QAD02_022270 [Eretmocerus hayati]|uniref:Uncharacterized protein n=1 Tax=Eretmocerus hayati TaxID=131215 RepID=A0ACC2PU53_9HYME|nr:hypothetical protein QAD02_022270 [Eretmocerus hayati]
MKRSDQTTFTCGPAVTKRLKTATTASDGGVSDPVTRIFSQPLIRVTPAVMTKPGTIAAVRNPNNPLPSAADDSPTKNPLASPFALATSNNEWTTPRKHMQHCHVIHVDAPQHMTASAQSALLAAITNPPMSPHHQQQQQVSNAQHRLQQPKLESATMIQQQQLQTPTVMSSNQDQEQQVTTMDEPAIQTSQSQHQLQDLPATSVQEKQQQQVSKVVTSPQQQQILVVSPHKVPASNTTEQQHQQAPLIQQPRIKVEKDLNFNTSLNANISASTCTEVGKTNSESSETASSTDAAEIADDRLCSKEFVEFLNSQDFSDVTLVADSGREFHAHKVVLSAKSPVFKNMLKLFGGEVKLRIEVKDVSEIVMEEVLRYIYSGTVTRVKSCAYELYLAAERYVLRELKERCAKAITVDNVTFTLDNAVNLLIISHQSCNIQLKKKSIEFINQHAAQIVRSVDFKKLVESHPYLLAELYFHIAVKTS